jgi:hypothetical protein
MLSPDGGFPKTFKRPQTRPLIPLLSALLPRTSPLAVGKPAYFISFTGYILNYLHSMVEHHQDDVASDLSSIDSNGFVHINSNAKPSPSTYNINMTETHTFPKELPDWSNLEVLHRNTLPPRASFFLYDTPEDALTRDVSKSKSLSLSGTWKFSLAKSPFDAPVNFHKSEYSTSEWGKIEVPGMWQLQGYGKGPQ